MVQEHDHHGRAVFQADCPVTVQRGGPCPEGQGSLPFERNEMNKWIRRMLVPLGAALIVPAMMGASAVSASTPTSVVCENSTTGLCMAVATGGSVIVATRPGGFQASFTNLSHMCGSGRVTETCPFTLGSGLNTHYFNDSIVAVSLPGGCLALGSVVGKCPDSSGNGGGNGTIDVLAATGTMHGYLPNRYGSDANYSKHEYNQPAWFCSPGDSSAHKGQLLLLKSSAPAATCQWGVYSK